MKNLCYYYYYLKQLGLNPILRELGLFVFIIPLTKVIVFSIEMSCWRQKKKKKHFHLYDY